MKKAAVFILSAGLLLGAGCGREIRIAGRMPDGGDRQASTTKARASLAIIEPTEQADSGTRPPAFNILTRSLDRKTDLFKVEAKLPELKGLLDEAAQDRFNETMRADTATSVQAFADYFDDVDKEEYKKTFQCFYEMDFRTVSHGHYLSVIMSGGEFTGGAHPAAIYRTYVFDLKDGKFLELRDLFGSGADYLTELSSSTLAEISKLDIGDADWNRSGTAPQAENFRFFWLADDGLHILFPPYQVASYAEGEHEIAIPYDEFPDLTGKIR